MYNITSRKKNWSINHSLTPTIEPNVPNFQPYQEYDYNEPPAPRRSSLSNPYKLNQTKYSNPLNQRSRKHRLMEEKNTEIERNNRMLYEKIRKIKMKNMYHSEKKIDPQQQEEQHNSVSMMQALQQQTKQQQMASSKNQRSNSFQFGLPPLERKSVKTSTTISNNMLSMNSTRSHLNSIFDDRNGFVEKYFDDLKEKKKNKIPEKQLGVYNCENGWRVRVLLVDGDNLLLVGKKKRKQLTKKYLYSRVKDKMTEGLEAWAKYKFSFEP